jgi:hypothetical protein
MTSQVRQDPTKTGPAAAAGLTCATAIACAAAKAAWR